MNSEYQEFINSGGGPVPHHLQNFSREYVKISLSPSLTIFKFFAIQLLGMVGTLYFCPLYGLNIGPAHSQLLILIMSYGPVVCGAFCGAVFFSGGALLNFIFLSKAQGRWLKENLFGMIVLFNTLVFIVMMTSKKIGVTHMHFQTFDFDGAWVISSFIVMLISSRYLDYGVVAQLKVIK